MTKGRRNLASLWPFSGPRRHFHPPARLQSHLPPAPPKQRRPKPKTTQSDDVWGDMTIPSCPSLPDGFKEMVARVRAQEPAISGALAQAGVIMRDDDRVVLAANAFAYGVLSTAKAKDLLPGVEVTKTGPGDKKGMSLDRCEELEKVVAQQKAKNRAKNSPVLADLIDCLGGEVVDVRFTAKKP